MSLFKVAHYQLQMASELGFMSEDWPMIRVD